MKLLAKSDDEWSQTDVIRSSGNKLRERISRQAMHFFVGPSKWFSLGAILEGACFDIDPVVEPSTSWVIRASYWIELKLREERWVVVSVSRMGLNC